MLRFPFRYVLALLLVPAIFLGASLVLNLATWTYFPPQEEGGVPAPMHSSIFWFFSGLIPALLASLASVSAAGNRHPLLLLTPLLIIIVLAAIIFSPDDQQLYYPSTSWWAPFSGAAAAAFGSFIWFKLRSASSKT